MFRLVARFDPERKFTKKVISISLKIYNLASKKTEDDFFICIGSLGPGGAERQWANIAINLKIRGFNPRIVILNDLSISSNWILDDLNYYGVDIISITKYHPSWFSRLIPFPMLFLETNSLNSFETLVSWYRNNIEFRKSLKLFCARQPLSVLISLDYSNLIFGTAGVYSRLNDIRISLRSVAPNHYDLEDFMKSDWLNLYRDLYLNQNIKWAANASHLNSSYANYLGCTERHDVALIPNELYISPHLLSDATNLSSVCDCSSFHILGLMRMSKEKSPESWLEFIKYLNIQFPKEFHFIIVGDGIMRKSIEKKVDLLKKNGLTIDMREPTDFVFPYFLLFGLVISSSIVEGHSNLEIEASYFGMKVINLFNQKNAYLESHMSTLPNNLINIESFQSYTETVFSIYSEERSRKISRDIFPKDQMFKKLSQMVDKILDL